MADNEEKFDLKKIEPLRPPPDAHPEPKPDLEDADRVGVPTAMGMNTPPAVGASAETIEERRATENEELERLRRS